MERAKDYDLTFEQGQGCVRVALRAPKVGHVTVLDYLGEIAVTCAKWHSRALIIERDVPMVLWDEEMLDSWGVFLNTRTEMRVALVNPYPTLERPLRRTIAAARASAVNVAYFENTAAAERWMEA
jgi:hypothetical protein